MVEDTYTVTRQFTVHLVIDHLRHGELDDTVNSIIWSAQDTGYYIDAGWTASIINDNVIISKDSK